MALECGMPMTPDAVVRSWFKEIWNEGREEAIDRLADENFSAHGAPSLRSSADFKVLFRQFRQALSDIDVTVERTVTQGEYCAGYCRVRGRHTGGRLRRSTQQSNGRVRRCRHGACTRWKDRRGLELFRLPIDVSADRVG